MKKVTIVFMSLVFNMFLISCTNDSISDTDSLYEIEATEGDDGQLDDGRGD